MSAGVVAALTAEARTLGSSRRLRAPPAAIADGTLVTVSGMGPAAARGAACALVDAGATALVSWGFAGGLDPSLAPGTLCLPTTVISAVGLRFGTDHHWREAVGAAVGGGRRVVDGTLLSTPYALHGVAAKAAAFRDTGAVAVDMESAAVAEVAAQRRLPFLVVRVIVDAARDALPGAVTAASGGEGVDLLKLLRGLLAAPGDLLPLLRLVRQYRIATHELKTVARSGALAPMAFAVTSGNRVT